MLSCVNIEANMFTTVLERLDMHTLKCCRPIFNLNCLIHTEKMGIEVGEGARMEGGIVIFNTFLIFFLVNEEQVGILLIIILSIFNSKSPCSRLFSSLNNSNLIRFSM